MNRVKCLVIVVLAVLFVSASGAFIMPKTADASTFLFSSFSIFPEAAHSAVSSTFASFNAGLKDVGSKPASILTAFLAHVFEPLFAPISAPIVQFVPTPKPVVATTTVVTTPTNVTEYVTRNISVSGGVSEQELSQKLSALKSEILSQQSFASTFVMPTNEQDIISLRKILGVPSGNTVIVTGGTGTDITGKDISVNNITAASITTTSQTATSTFGHGLDVTGGCISLNGTCLDFSALSSSGIFSLNGLTSASQTFATSNDTNIGLAVTSVGTTHTFTPSWIGVLGIARGGTGISTTPSNGQILLGNNSGGYTLSATSSLGITSSQWITSGSNVYYTGGNIGVGTSSPFASLSVNGNGFFGGNVTASNIIATGTLAVSGTASFGAGTSTFVGGIQANALNITSASATSTFASGINVGSGCFAINGTCITAGGSGTISSLNGLVASTQTFATTSDANIGLNIVSSGSTHTFSPTWTGTLAVGRGGTGLSSATANQILIGNSGGTGFTQVATSSLGLLTTNVNEGSNLYFTNARAQGAISVSGLPLTYSGGVIGINQASAAQDGYLSSANFTIFSNKFATTSTDYYLSTKLTTNLAEGSNLYYTDTRVNSYVNGSTTIPKTYTTNTFTAAQTFNGGISASGLTTTNLTLTGAGLPSCSGSQALQTDGAGLVSCGNISVGGGSSSGGGWTSNTPFVTLATTTYTVGIGATTSPYAKLTILSGATGTTTLALVPTSGQTANILDIYNTNGSLDSVISSSGNFGIGTTSPYARLSVSGQIVGAFFTATTTATSTFAGGIQTAALNVTSSSATSTFANGINLGAGCFSVNGICLGTGGSGSGTVNSGTSGQFAYYASSGSTVSGTSALTISGTNIGIGTSTPYAALSVAGTGVFDNIVATSTTAVSSFAGTVGIGTTQPGSGVALEINKDVAGTFTGLRVSNFHDGNTQIQFNNVGAFDTYSSSITSYHIGTPSDLAFATWNQNGGITEMFRLAGTTGGSGFGTTSPDAALAVEGNPNYPNLPLFDLASSTNTSLFRVTRDGFVGIGTTSPGSILSIGNTGANTINISNTATSTFGTGINVTGGCFAVNGSCLTSGSGTVNSGTTGQVPYYASAGSALTATSTLFISSSGNVGVGTAGPSNKLSVQDLITSTTTGRILSGDTLIVSLSSPITNPVSYVGHSVVTEGLDFQSNPSTFEGLDSKVEETLGGTIANAIGVQSTIMSVYGAGSHITNGYGYRSLAQTSGASDNIGTYSAFYASSPFGSGTVTNNYAFISEPGAGNSGFGTTSPWAQLSINPTSANGTAPSFVIGSSTGTSFLVSNNGNVTVGTTSLTSSNFNVGGSMTLTDFGITSSPTLTINSSRGVSFSGGGDVRIVNPTAEGASLTLRSTDAGGGQPWTFISAGSANGEGATVGSLSLFNNSTLTIPFSISSTNNIGIGTTTPGTILSVNGVGNFASGVSTIYSSLTAPNFTATSTTATSTFAGNITIGGNNIYASGNSLALGQTFLSGATNGSISATQDSIAFGRTNGSGSAIGEIISASQPGSFAGGEADVNGINSTGSIISNGTATFAFGYEDILGISKTKSITSSGTASFALGFGLNRSITSSGEASFAGGGAQAGDITSSGTGSFAWGDNLTASSDYSFALGTGFTNSTTNTFQVGYSAIPTLTVNSTSLGVGSTTPWAKLSVSATGGGSAPLFAVASSTNGTGTSTPFIIDAYGNITATGSLTLASLTGPLQAINGLISATSSLSAAYGGTGISTPPTFGQMLVGNSSGGYTLTATSSLGIGSQWTTQSGNIYFNTGNVGVGTTSPFAKLSLAGAAGATANLFTISTSTSGFATSTAIVVDQNGKFGIGTSSPTSQLSVVGNEYLVGDLTLDAGADRTIKINNSTSGSGNALTIQSGSAAPGGDIYSGGDINIKTGAGAADTAGNIGGIGGSIRLTGANGGDSITSGGGTNVGGGGGSFAFNGGTGGSGGNSSFFNAGGTGGGFTVFGGTGGIVTTAGGLENFAPDGGGINFQAGVGGSGVTADVAGGFAGSIQIGSNVTGGGAGGAGQAGGRGSNISIIATNGGASAQTSGGTNTGGAGGNLILTAGVGGSASNGGVNVGGAAGIVTITGGDGSINTSGGNVYLIGGAKAGTGKDGNILLGLDSSGNIRGNVGIGTSSPYASLSVAGRGIFDQDVRANYFTATSTTIASAFPYASTTALTVSGTNGLTIGSLTGPLQAINGLVSSTSTLSVFYGGTGISTAPTFGQLLVGNSSGGYTLTSTSSLGIGSPWTTSGSNIFYNTGNIGIGSTTPWANLSIAGTSLGTANLFAVSTSTASATSTAFIIDSNGKVGIGTSSPTSALSVVGNEYLVGDLTFDAGVLTRTIKVNNSTSGVGSGLNIQSGSAASGLGTFVGGDIVFLPGSGGDNTGAVSNGAAGNAGSVALTGGTGGTSAASGGNFNTGGAGTALSFIAGTGGTAANSTILNIGGSGGSIALHGGNGGIITAATGFSNLSGAGGAVTISSGGGASGVTTSINGGNAGSITIGSNLAAGGDGGAGHAGGAGINLSLLASAGGDSSQTSGGTNTGGAGGNLVLTGGTGGSASNGGTNVGGAAGSVSITGGAGSVNTKGGNIYLIGGAKAGTGTDGNILLGINSSGTIRGNVGIGTSSPYASLSVAGRGVFNQDVQADFFTATSTTATSSFAYSINVTNGCVAVNGACLGSGSGTVNAGTTGQLAYYPSSSNAVNGTSAIVISGSNIGIATATPATTLGVGGSGYFTGGLGVGVLNTTSGTLQTSGNATIGGVLAVSGTGTSTFANISASGNINAANYLINSNPLAYNTGTNFFFAGTQPNGAVSGTNNLAFGTISGAALTSGSSNVFLGNAAGAGNTSGSNNIFLGGFSGNGNISGNENIFLGDSAGLSNTSGSNNIFQGFNAGISNSRGTDNIFLGDTAGFSNDTGSLNIFEGLAAGYNNVSGSGIVAIGANALKNTTGASSTALGYNAGLTNSSGTFNTFLGYGADASTGGLTNATAIGKNAIVSASNSIVLGGTGANAVNVGIGTSSPYATLSVVGDVVAKDFVATSSTATSTFAGNVVIGGANVFAQNNSLAVGFTSGSNTLISAGSVSNQGSFAGGYTQTNSGSSAQITSSGVGSFAYGFASSFGAGAVANITASAFGATALGYVNTISGQFYSLRAISRGAFAGGDVETGTTTASGHGAFAFGDNLTVAADYATAFGIGFNNSTANSFEVGYSAIPTLTVNSTSLGVGSTTPWAKLSVSATGGGATPLFAVASSTNGTGTSTAFIIDKNGNVGIGTTSPASTLTVTGSACISQGAGATAACSTTAGHISAVSHDTANVDLAENYDAVDQTIVAGDVVSIDPDNNNSVIKATTGNTIIGVVSTQPGVLLGADEQNKKLRPVALAGRVPVKVSMEGGIIHRGDYLTLSSTPGVAMKAASTTINVIGTALEDSSGAGAVLTFIRPGFANIGDMNAAQALVTDDSSFLDTFNALIAGTKQWMFGEVSAVTGIFKNIFAQKVTTQQLCLGDKTDLVCISKDQLRTLLQNANLQTAAAGTGALPSGTGSGNGTGTGGTTTVIVSTSTVEISTSTSPSNPSPLGNSTGTGTTTSSIPSTNGGTTTPVTPPTLPVTTTDTSGGTTPASDATSGTNTTNNSTLSDTTTSTTQTTTTQTDPTAATP